MLGVNGFADAALLVLRVIFDPLNIVVSAIIAVVTTWGLWLCATRRRPPPEGS